MSIPPDLVARLYRAAVPHSCTAEYSRAGFGHQTDINQTRTHAGRTSRPSGRVVHRGGKSLRLVDQGVSLIDGPRPVSPGAHFIPDRTSPGTEQKWFPNDNS